MLHRRSDYEDECDHTPFMVTMIIASSYVTRVKVKGHLHVSKAPLSTPASRDRGEPYLNICYKATPSDDIIQSGRFPAFRCAAGMLSASDTLLSAFFVMRHMTAASHCSYKFFTRSDTSCRRLRFPRRRVCQHKRQQQPCCVYLF